jgi:hypothetical protein
MKCLHFHPGSKNHLLKKKKKGFTGKILRKGTSNQQRKLTDSLLSLVDELQNKTYQSVHRCQTVLR